MRTVRSIVRCVQKFGQAPRLVRSSVRSASTLARLKIVEGENGERIIPSPFGEPELPEALIQDHIWKNLAAYRNLDALECAVTGRKYTYAEARDAANFVAKSLLNMGLKRGDVVALIAPNYPETILGFLGILEAQLVVTTANPFYTADEIARQLKSSGAKAAIVAAETLEFALPALKQNLPEGAPIVVIENSTSPVPDGTIPFQEVLRRGRTLPTLNLSDVPNDSLAVLPYSSGTTGLPKGVMLTHRNLVSNMEMVEQTTGNMFQVGSESFQEVIPLILPFFHIFGMNCATLPRLATGIKIITLPNFVPEMYASIFVKHKVTGLFCVPPIVLFMSTSPLLKKNHLEAVHLAISGAAPLSETDVERFYDKFGMNVDTMKFCQGYGLTETSPACFFEVTGRKFASIGKNIAGCDARLVDPTTKEDISRPGQPGELWVRGPHIMKGYLNNEEATKETIGDGGWLKTGDVGYFDEELDFFITDRMKELIKVKGFQVPPAELEALLRTHPDIEEAAVLGIPNERYGEVPIAFIVPRKDKKPVPEVIKDFVNQRVSEHKHLRGGVRVVDSIPKNPTGKIQRAKLKQEYLLK